MDRHIHLKDCDQFECPASSLNVHFRPESIAAARAALIKRDLRFDNETGVMRDSSGLLEKLRYPAEFEPHRDVESVFLAEFTRRIRNGASMIERGFKP